MSETNEGQSFHALSIPGVLLSKLDREGIVTPTPIQAKAIPPAMEGHDVMGIAQTGTGKTLAFALPILARLGDEGYLALVLAPTRELAEQIAKVFQMLGARTALLVGGEGMQKQKGQLSARPQVIIATPGRLEDHVSQGLKMLKHTRIAVLDEADRMLDMGFAPAIRRILDLTPSDRQTMLFSATMPDEIADLAARYQREPVRVEIKQAGTTNEDVEQQLIFCAFEDKRTVLEEILAEQHGTVLVFSRTRHGARKLATAIRHMGHKAAEIHADRTLSQRREALDGFKKGRYRVLVATDIAARGIDVKEISVVLNYDVPENPEDYVHRIGRTGRAGSTGLAITLSTPEQARDVRDIERLIRAEIPIGKGSMERPMDGRRLPKMAARPASELPIHPARFANKPERAEKAAARIEEPAPVRYSERLDRSAPSMEEAAVAREDRPSADRPTPSTHRKPYGDRPSGGYGERKSYGDRKPQGDRPSSGYGERKSYGDRPSGGYGERKSYGDRPSGGYGERKSYGDRPSGGYGERKSYGDRPSGGYGERKSYGDRPSGGYGERKSYGDRPGGGYGERKSYGDRPGGGYGERKPQGDRPSGGYGERKSYGDRPSGGYSERKSYGDRPSGGYGDRGPRPYGVAKRYDDRPAKPTHDRPAQPASTGRPPKKQAPPAWVKARKGVKKKR